MSTSSATPDSPSAEISQVQAVIFGGLIVFLAGFAAGY
jgi:hypothetical protein